MAGYGQGTEGAQMASVLERDEAERDDDEEDGLFVDVPAKQKRGISTQRDGPYEAVPGGQPEQLGERDGLEQQRQRKANLGCDIRQHRKCRVPNKAARDAL